MSKPHTSEKFGTVVMHCMQTTMSKSEQFPYEVGRVILHIQTTTLKSERFPYFIDTIVHVAKDNEHSLLMLLDVHVAKNNYSASIFSWYGHSCC